MLPGAHRAGKLTPSPPSIHLSMFVQASHVRRIKYFISCSSHTKFHTFTLDFRKVKESIRPQRTVSAVAKIDSLIEVVVLQKEGSISSLNVSVNPDL